MQTVISFFNVRSERDFHRLCIGVLFQFLTFVPQCVCCCSTLVANEDIRIIITSFIENIRIMRMDHLDAVSQAALDELSFETFELSVSPTEADTAPVPDASVAVAATSAVRLAWSTSSNVAFVEQSEQPPVTCKLSMLYKTVGRLSKYYV